MTVTLALDTSADVLAGVARDGRPLARRAVHDRRAHAERLIPLVNEVLADAGLTLADVDEIVVGVGPGPFTGLRVGVVTATTLAAVLGVDVKGVCSLDAVAAQWVAAGSAPGEFVVVSDARRREVYWARYGAGGVRVEGPSVTAPGSVPDLPLGGPGASLVREAEGSAGLRESDGPSELDAAVLAAHGSALPDAGLEPLYLRRPDAEVSTKRKSTLVQPKLRLGRVR